MNYQELLELKHKRSKKLDEGKELLEKKDFEGHKALLAEVEKMNLEIDAVEKQLAEEGRFSDGDGRMKALAAEYRAKQEDKAKGAAVDSIRRTNEYANAFAKAMRSGVTVKRARGVEAMNPCSKPCRRPVATLRARTAASWCPRTSTT